MRRDLTLQGLFFCSIMKNKAAAAGGPGGRSGLVLRGGAAVKEHALQWKKGDLLAAVLVLALAAASFCVWPLLRQEGRFARIYQNGTLVREVPLSVNQSFSIQGAYTNVITVRDGRIAVTQSDCPTNDCVRMGWIRDGGSIICLPNGVEIRIAGDTAVDAVIP